MFSGKRSAALITVLAVILSAEMAFSNGINPPRPSSANIVSAIYKERSGGKQRKIFRARITKNGESADSLKFRIDGATEQIDITVIRSITFTTRKIGPDGFIKARLVRSDVTEEKSVMVQVKANNKEISLAGFEENGTRVSIDLTKCKRVEFSSIITPNGSYRPVEKK